jgi:tRNA modification GTPase
MGVSEYEAPELSFLSMTTYASRCSRASRWLLQPPLLLSYPAHRMKRTTRLCHQFKDADSLRLPTQQRSFAQQISPRHPVGAPNGGIQEDTIFALSTASGRAAIAIIRISGPECIHIYQALCPGKAAPSPRYATIRTLYDPDQGFGEPRVLDPEALVLYFPGPKSATGEDVLELHVHGGLATVRAVLEAIPRYTFKGASKETGNAQVRYAEPGEFTQRAFFNNRLSLPQVESLSDILSAATEQQRRLSVQGIGRALTRQYEEWRHLLLLAQAEIEALIDFSEDQHFDESPTALMTSVSSQVTDLIEKLEVYAENATRGELLRNGIVLALIGAPNAGKSSLLNCIVGREAAIVSQEAGTTRDIVEAGIDISGYFVRLADTAGLRVNSFINKDGGFEKIGSVETEGIRRAKARAAESDLVIVVLSFERDISTGKIHLNIDPEVIAAATEYKNVVIALNKSDLIDSEHRLLSDKFSRQIKDSFPSVLDEQIVRISCLESASGVSSGGITELSSALVRSFRQLTSPLSLPSPLLHDNNLSNLSLSTTARQKLLLEECLACLRTFLVTADSKLDRDGEVDIVLAAEHLRSAALALGKLTGKGEAGDVEAILGVVFEKFCVGK